MNEIEKQEIDPPEPEQAESTGLAGSPDSTQAPSKAPIKLALIALILALAGSGVSYMKLSGLGDVLQQDRQALADLKKQQQETKSRLDRAAQDITAQEEALKQQDANLKLQTDEMQQSIDLVYERVGRNSTQWIVAEAEYLMRIANHRLQLEGDSATALVALMRADKRLHDSGDPAWTAIRERLAIEIAELKGLKQLDLAGQAAKVSGLISQVDKLKLPHSVQVTSEQPEDIAKEEQELSFDRVLRDVWGGLKSLLKIRRNDRPVTSMLEPDQRFFLYQNLRLQLEGARLALLRRDKTLFDASLQRVESWVKEFFDQDDALTMVLLKGVKELSGLELEAKMPDISGSLHLLLEQQGQADEEPQQTNVEQKPAEVQKSVEEQQAPAEEEFKPVDEGQKTTSEEDKPIDGDQKQGEQGLKQSDQEQGEPQSERKEAP